METKNFVQFQFMLNSELSIGLLKRSSRLNPDFLEMTFKTGITPRTVLFSMLAWGAKLTNRPQKRSRSLKVNFVPGKSRNKSNIEIKSLFYKALDAHDRMVGVKSFGNTFQRSQGMGETVAQL